MAKKPRIYCHFLKETSITNQPYQKLQLETINQEYLLFTSVNEISVFGFCFLHYVFDTVAQSTIQNRCLNVDRNKIKQTTTE